MSSFTEPLQVEAVRRRHTSWWRWLPPGWHDPRWITRRKFTYLVGTEENPTDRITVDCGFEFNGASVPFGPSLFIPKSHPDYLQAAALHDFMYCSSGSRRYADYVFREALGVLGMAAFWR